jgi:uncharacterized coiled-coil protein SlyX
MEVRTVSELSARINRLEARVAEDRQVIASQQEAIGFQQAMLRDLSDAYDLFESAVIELANHDLEGSPAPDKPNLRLLH